MKSVTMLFVFGLIALTAYAQKDFGGTVADDLIRANTPVPPACAVCVESGYIDTLWVGLMALKNKEVDHLTSQCNDLLNEKDFRIDQFKAELIILRADVETIKVNQVKMLNYS